MAFEPLTVLSVVRGKRRKSRASLATVEPLADWEQELLATLKPECRDGVCKHRANRCCCGCGEWLDECSCAGGYALLSTAFWDDK